LKKELETLKQEKEVVDGKLAGLLLASKYLDNLIESQRKFSTGSRNFPTANKKFSTPSRKFPTGSTKGPTADMGMKGKAVKPSSCWSWNPSQNLSNKGPKNNSVSVMFKKYTYIDTQGRLKSDSGCSRHMTGNISYLSDFKPFDEGYVSFGQKGCKIIGKGEFEALMHEKFQMSAMGELNFFLGLQVLQKEDGIFLSQDKYVGDILKKFGYTDVRSSNTPMDKENPWGQEGIGKDVDLHLYRSMIRSLMYLTASRPDIMFVVCAYARYQVTPKECHLHAVKRIFRYLKGHPKLGLWYPKDSPFDLVSFSDSDYSGATQDRKSTTEGCQFLGRRLISWKCKKQTIVATSTTEEEYVAAASCCGQVLWIQN
nr:uncharacterized mitochondrial protein AtMg00810-like [Tanacetum cinerariifolium]